MTRRNGTSKDPLDRNFTPDLLALAVTEAVDALINAETALDLGCGDGAFLRAWGAVGVQADAVDLDPIAVKHARAAGHQAAEADAWEFCVYAASAGLTWDAVVGNPAFRHIVPWTRAALTVARACCWIIPATAFNGAGGDDPEGRRAFWLAPPAPIRHVWSILDRPTFALDGSTDATSYAAVLWDREHKGPAGWGTLAAPTAAGWGRPIYREIRR